MSDFVIRSGDTITITIPPPAVVPALEAPVPLEGSGAPVTIEGLSVCLLGDELPAILREPLPYTSPPFTVPGMGTLTLTLTPANMTVTTRKGKPLLIKGGPFVATFAVTEPAQQITPAGPIPDPLVEKVGTAQFVTTNEIVLAG
jgi:hypothetical protein